jgi:hypothetical protein
MDNNIFLFIIFCIFFILFYFYFTNIENFSFCEEEYINSNGGICIPFYGIPPSLSIYPYTKTGTGGSTLIEADNAERLRKNKYNINIKCANDSNCKGYFINHNPNSEHEGYLCKSEWDGENFGPTIQKSNIDFKLYRCRNRLNTLDNCTDHPGHSGSTWTDGTNDCDGYAENPEWCANYGNIDHNGEGKANDKCCACGGGGAGKEYCINLVGNSGATWTDGTNDCDGYAENPEWCANYGNIDQNGEGKANEKCCTCGGGRYIHRHI